MVSTSTLGGAQLKPAPMIRSIPVDGLRHLAHPVERVADVAGDHLAGDGGLVALGAEEDLHALA